MTMIYDIVQQMTMIYDCFIYVKMQDLTGCTCMWDEKWYLSVLEY